MLHAAGVFSAPGTSQLGAGGSGTLQLGAGGSRTSQVGAGAFSDPGTSQLGESSYVYVTQSHPHGQQVLQNPMEVCNEFSNLNKNNVGSWQEPLHAAQYLEMKH